jgi:hypothetical protein
MQFVPGSFGQICKRLCDSSLESRRFLHGLLEGGRKTYARNTLRSVSGDFPKRKK